MVRKRIRKSYTAFGVGVLILAMILPAILPAGPANASDVSLSASYDILKADPANSELLNRLMAQGGTDANIGALLGDLQTTVEQSGTLTDTNFNHIMMEAFQDVVTRRAHRVIFRALMNAFPDEIDYTLQNRELHPTLLPLRNAVHDALLGVANQPEQTQEQSGGGGSSLPAVLDDPLLQSVKDQVSLGLVTIQQTSNEISLSATVWQQINQSNAQMELKLDKVTLKIPASAVSIASSANLAISAKPSNSQIRSAAVSDLKSGQKLAGEVYEFLATTEATIFGFSFQKPIEITLPYKDGLTQSEVDKLDAFFYDEILEEWTAMKGVINRNNKTVTFTTNHFSLYAVLVNDAQQNTKVIEEKPQQEQTQQSNPETIGSHFSDITSHWAKSYIEQMVSQGLLSGISPTQFAPDRKITRAEFAAILVRSLKIPATNIVKGQFQDVAANQWYFTPVNEAAKAGIISGTSTSTFEPNRPVTREQMAVMISRAMAYRGKNIASNEDQLNIFTDRGKISSWARQGVAAAVANGIVKGRGAGTFAPADNATRAEGAVMILNMLK